MDMKGIKLLLVDDEVGFVTTLAERLELRGIIPQVTFNGEDALRLIEQDQPHVVVLDLRMPGMSGSDVLRRIRVSWPKVEVIMLTGHGSDQNRETCLDLGAHAYHNKPLDIEMLIESIRNAARAAGIHQD